MTPTKPPLYDRFVEEATRNIITGAAILGGLLMIKAVLTLNIELMAGIAGGFILGLITSSIIAVKAKGKKP